MNDRGLGYIMAVIFVVAGVLLFVVSLVAPDVVENSIVTLLGGVFGIGLALSFGVATVVRKHRRIVGSRRGDEHPAAETSH